MWIRLFVVLTIALFVGAFLLTEPGEPPPAEPPPPKDAKAATRFIHIVASTTNGRCIRHPLGESWVPLAPKRIVALSGYNNYIADGLVALGVRPVGVEGSWMSRRRPVTYLADKIGKVPAVAIGGTINLEAVLNLKPDLIFISPARYGRFYDSLSKIAPTVAIEAVNIGGIDESVILDIGAAIGRAETAEKVLADLSRLCENSPWTIGGIRGGQPRGVPPLSTKYLRHLQSHSEGRSDSDRSTRSYR